MLTGFLLLFIARMKVQGSIGVLLVIAMICDTIWLSNLSGALEVVFGCGV